MRTLVGKLFLIFAQVVVGITALWFLALKDYPAAGCFLLLAILMELSEHNMREAKKKNE